MSTVSHGTILCTNSPSLWLCDLSKELPPSVQLDGFDVSSEQFMHANFLQHNVKLEEVDARSEVPAHLRDRYDVVHVRLLQAAVEKDNPAPFVEHCMQLLSKLLRELLTQSIANYRYIEPGGWLQWDEYDTSNFQKTHVGEGSTQHLDALARAILDARPMGCVFSSIWPRARKGYSYLHRPSWIPKLPERLQHAGFSQVQKQVTWDRDIDRPMMMQMWCMLAEEHAEAMYDKAGASQVGDQLRKIAEGSLQEITQGAAYAQMFQIVLAQKPAMQSIQPTKAGLPSAPHNYTALRRIISKIEQTVAVESLEDDSLRYEALAAVTALCSKLKKPWDFVAQWVWFQVSF